MKGRGSEVGRMGKIHRKKAHSGDEDEDGLVDELGLSEERKSWQENASARLIGV